MNGKTPAILFVGALVMLGALAFVSIASRNATDVAVAALQDEPELTQAQRAVSVCAGLVNVKSCNVEQTATATTPHPDGPPWWTEYVMGALFLATVAAIVIFAVVVIAVFLAPMLEVGGRW